jgi:hypothetical protein
VFRFHADKFERLRSKWETEGRTGYRLTVSGEIGAKELGRIIKILTLQQELLSETDEEAAERPQQLEHDGARWEGFGYDNTCESKMKEAAN